MMGSFIRARACIVRLSVAALALFVLSACEGPWSDGHGGCRKDFEKTIVPFEIQGNKHLRFHFEDLEFLLDRDVKVDSMELELVLDGKFKGQDGEVTLSLNGYQSCGRGHDPYYRIAGYDSFRGHSKCRFNFRRMGLNGGVPLSRLMTLIFLNRGELRINPTGKNVKKIVSAQLVVEGSRKVPCGSPSPSPTPSGSPSPNPSPSPTPSPSPSPTPPPVAPDTLVDSASPSGSVVASTNMAVAFSSDQVNVTYTCTLDGSSESCASPKLYSNLGNGTHTFTVAATNSAGLTDGTPASYSWTIDTTPPNVVITNAASLPSLTNLGTISVEFSSSEASSYECVIDGGTAVACESPVQYAGLTEGSHLIAIYGVDSVGNRSVTPASFQWTIDQTIPITRLVQVNTPDTLTNSTTKSFDFSANEPSTFECSIDQAGFGTCESPVSLASLAAGDHSFEVRATDLAGNVGHTASFLWRIDLTAPVLTLGQTTPPQGLTNAQMIAVEFSADEQSTYSCDLDGGGAVACASPYTAAISTEGGHALVITARDTAGNLSTPVQLSWTMDFTPPTLAFGAFTPSPATYLSANYLTAEVVSSEMDSLSCKLNDIDLNQNASPVSVSSLAEGAYTLWVAGTDVAGNTSAPITHFFVVDVTAPVTTLADEHDGTTTKETTNTLTFSSNEGSSFECNYDGAGFSTCQSPFALSGASEGAHAFQVRATDLAGNVGPVAEVHWSVDLTPPVTSISTIQTSANSFTFTLSANEPVSVFECSLDGASFSSCGSSVTQSGLSEGTHTFTARATDTSGNLDLGGTSVQVTVQAQISTQITSNIPSAAITNSPNYQVFFTANQPGATFTCSLDGAAPSACVSPMTYNVGEGPHSFRVWAIDQYGVSDPTGASHSWTVDTTVPVSSLTANRTANNSITFTFSANEPACNMQCLLDGLVTSCNSPLVLNNLAVGSHNIRVRAVDQAGNVGFYTDPAYTWTVDPPVTTTIGTATPSATPTQSSSMSITFSSNLPTATFQCSWDSGAFSACASPAVRSGLGDGPHTFRVKAVDQWGTEDATGGPTYLWTVDTAAPTITVGPSATVTSTSMTIVWTTNEQASSRVDWGIGTNTNNVVAEDSNFVTSHTKTVSGLLPNTTYSYIVSGHDRAGNAYVSVRRTVRTNP